MSISLGEALEQVRQINSKLKSTVANYGDYGDEIDYNGNDPDEAFLHVQLAKITSLLQDASDKISYLDNPVSEQGIIRHNKDGRYELKSGYYFTSGSVCEIYNYNKFYERYEWTFTSIEHNGEDYYATALGKDVSIDGMTVRVRRKTY